MGGTPSRLITPTTLSLLPWQNIRQGHLVRFRSPCGDYDILPDWYGIVQHITYGNCEPCVEMGSVQFKVRPVKCTPDRLPGNRISGEDFVWITLDRVPTLQYLPENLTNKYQHYFAAVCIQRSWRKAIGNPLYKLCRQRLANEFQDLKRV